MLCQIGLGPQLQNLSFYVAFLIGTGPQQMLTVLFNFFYNFKFSFWPLFFEVKGRHLHLFEKNIYTRFVDAAHARGQICRFFGIELIKIYLIEN